MIPETIERIKNSERAVSPVIGVILMVAITVILAAVIAAFVLGFGADQDSAPQATWSISQSGELGTDYELTLTHEGGDAVPTENLYLRGAGQDDMSLDNVEDTELRGGMSITIDETTEYVTGLGETFDFDQNEEVRLVWEVGDDSSTLRTISVDG